LKPTRKRINNYYL